MRLDTLVRLAGALEVTPDTLLGYDYPEVIRIAVSPQFAESHRQELSADFRALRLAADRRNVSNHALLK